MKTSQVIEVARLTSELISAQSKLAFYMEKAEHSVSREKYEAVIAERDAAISQAESMERVHAVIEGLSKALMPEMKKCREAWTEYGVLARRAADYLLDDRQGFCAFLRYGLLEIGNNAVEGCFRSIAKGRENWLQCGSHDASGHTAFMYSLVESCRMNDLDFGYYIETVLTRIQEGDTDFHGMLPSVIILPETAGNISAA